jgi:hypothetical protein
MQHLCWAGILFPHSLSNETYNPEILILIICFTAHIAGGTHHAFQDYGEGFCIFSGKVLA